jgi:hypothetical protein
MAEKVVGTLSKVSDLVQLVGRRQWGRLQPAADFQSAPRQGIDFALQPRPSGRGFGEVLIPALTGGTESGGPRPAV